MLISTQSRTQTILFTSLEDLVSPDNTVRLIDIIIDAIIMKSPTDYKYKGESQQGRPAYSVSVMLKLFLYGCINRINSSRRLEVESKRNIELMWLLGNLAPDFKTIADFRKDNKALISKCNKDVKSLLKHNGLISGAVISVDGTKLKGNAGRDMFSKNDLLKRIVSLETDFERYVIQMDRQDEQESAEASHILTLKEDYEKKIAGLHGEISFLQTAIDKMQNDKKNYISLTDLDCSKQKSRDGVIPGYNVQMGCDTQHGFIVAEDVTIESNDINQLQPMVAEIEHELSMSPGTVIADTGYCNYDDIQEIEAKGTQCFVPPQKEQKKTPSITFTYDKDNDRYICSEGKYLELEHKNKKYKHSWVNVYVGVACKTCPLAVQCTSSKRGRHISRYWNQDYRDSHRTKMSSAIAWQFSMLRKTTIEPIFGTAKVWLGKIPLLTRGIENVKTEIKIFSISFNLKKLINLFSFHEITSMIERFLGLDCQRTFIFSFKMSFLRKYLYTMCYAC